MKNDVVEVFREINDLFNFENNITKPSLQGNIREIKLQPYLQGNIDQLCGIYSLINATRLVIPSKIKPHLLSRCVSVLSQKKRSGDFITNGLFSTDIHFLLKEIFCKEYPIRFTKPFSKAVDVDNYWSKLKQFLNESSNRAVVILFYTESAGHWTVVNAITETQLILFDSKKTRNLTREICTTTELSESKTRLLMPTMTYFIKQS